MSTEKKRFLVRVREVWVQTFAVDAEDEEHALSAVLDGQGEPVDGELEYGWTPSGETVQTTVDHVEEE